MKITNIYIHILATEYLKHGIFTRGNNQNTINQLPLVQDSILKH